MLFDETVKWRIVSSFFEKPETEFFVKEMARGLDVSPGSTSRVCKELEAEGILSAKEKGRALFYSLRDSPLVRRLKSAWFLSRLHRFRDAWESEEFQSVALYGSRSSGEYISKSDVDILIITNDPEAEDRFKNMKAEFGQSLALSSLSVAQWRKMAKERDRFYIEVISNHILLFGSPLVIG